MSNTELLFFTNASVLRQPVMTWLLQDTTAVSETTSAHPIQAEIGYLREQLRSTNRAFVQRQAALQLAALGGMAVEALVTAMHSENETTQVLAAYALQKIGTEAIKPLLGILDTCPLRMRQKLLWVLYMNANEQTVDVLIRCLSDEDGKVRRYAAWGLGYLQCERAIPELVAALDDAFGKVRFDAGMALVKIGEAAVGALLDTLTNGSARARSQAAAILAWLQQNDNAFDALTDALRDSNPQVRVQAAMALGWMGRSQAVDALLEALYDEQAEVRMQAALALGWIGDVRAIDGLIGLIFDEDDWVPFSAADALGNLGGIRAIAPLMLASRGRNPRVREAATRALRQLGTVLN